MPDAISITLSGEPVEVPRVVNFATLERIGPAVDAFNAAVTRIQQVSAACAVMAGALAGTRAELDTGEIKKRLRVDRNDGVDETSRILDAVSELLDASGLVPKGEPKPPATEPAPAAAEGSI